MSTQNKCKRCGRKLSDPQANYGWRCAEKMGLAETLSKAPYEIFARFTEGVEKAERMFKNMLKHSSEKAEDIISAVVKWNLWDDTDKNKAEKAKQQLFKKVDDTELIKEKIDLKKEISDLWQNMNEKFNEFVDNTLDTISKTSKKLAKDGKLDDVTNHVLKLHDNNIKHIETALLEDVRDDNYKYNSKIDLSSYKGKYINDQNTGIVSKLRFGNHNMDYNGCEIIAVYNSLLTLGESKDIRDIAYEFEEDGMMLGGSFGTNPYAIERYFKKEKYHVEVLKGEEITQKKIPDADTYILSFWNSDDVMDALHTVSVRKDKSNKYIFYNDDITGEEMPSDSIYQRINEEKYQPIILQCISKKRR